MALQGNGFLYIGKMGKDADENKLVEENQKHIPFKMDFIYPAEHKNVGYIMETSTEEKGEEKEVKLFCNDNCLEV